MRFQKTISYWTRLTEKSGAIRSQTVHWSLTNRRDKRMPRVLCTGNILLVPSVCMVHPYLQSQGV